MNTTEAIITTMDISSMVLKGYVGDLTDSDLMNRPQADCNHLAWQLGHLIASECSLLEQIQPGAAAKLPDRFAEKHTKETTGVNDPAKFCTKQEYLDLHDKVREATKTALEKTSAADLDLPGPEEFREFMPTVGHVYIMIATHAMMHAGQFVPVRRALGKPILF